MKHTTLTGSTTHSEQELEKRIGKIIAPLLFPEPFVSFTLNDTGKRRVAEKTDELRQLIQSEREKVIKKISSFDLAEEGMRHATIGELFPELIEALAQKENK